MTKGEIYFIQSYQLGICTGSLNTFSQLIHAGQGPQDRLIIDGVIVKKMKPRIIYLT
jgi:hypothetical protein